MIRKSSPSTNKLRQYGGPYRPRCTKITIAGPDNYV